MADNLTDLVDLLLKNQRTITTTSGENGRGDSDSGYNLSDGQGVTAGGVIVDLRPDIAGELDNIYSSTIKLSGYPLTLTTSASI